MSYPGDETFSWQEQMWHVVDWLLVQDVEKVPDSLLAEFLLPVHEDNFPASIAARLQLRQLRVWLRDLKTKGEDHARDEAEDLLDGLLDLSEDTSRDGEYPLRTLSRKALKPPRALLKMVKKQKTSLEDLATGVDKYVEKAENAFGPCWISKVVKNARTVYDEPIEEAEEEDEEAATTAEVEVEEQRSPAGKGKKRARRHNISPKVRKPRNVLIQLQEEEEEVQPAEEDRAQIERLHQSRANLRRAGGADPLQEALANASGAKLKGTTEDAQEEEEHEEEEEEEEEHEEENTPKPSKGRFTDRQTSAQAVEWDTQDEIEGDEEKIVNAAAVGRRPLRQRNTNTRERRKSQKWLPEEADLLEHLTEKLGEGKWKKILLEGQARGGFAGRTSVDLKDKYRNITKKREMAMG